MHKLEISSDVERKLADLTIEVKRFRKTVGTRQKLPANILAEAIELSKLTSVSKVALIIGVSSSCLYQKINTQKTDMPRKNHKGKKSRHGFLEVTQLLNNGSDKPFIQDFSNFQLGQQMTSEFKSTGTHLYLDLVRPDGFVMKIQGNSLQINLANLMNQFIRGGL